MEIENHKWRNGKWVHENEIPKFERVYNVNPNKPLITQVCKLCNIKFNYDRKRKYCSDYCCQKANKKERKNQFLGVIEGKRYCRFCKEVKEITEFKGKLNGNGIMSYGRCNPCLDQYEYDRRRKAGKKVLNRQYPKSNIWVINCERTGELFVSRTKVKFNPKLKRISKSGRSSYIPQNYKPLIDLICVECDAPYQRTEGRINATLRCTDCTDKESNRINKRRRRYAELSPVSDNVSPYEVFTRDNWTCQLCGIPTPKNLRGKGELNSPELDHIIPISKGGHHTFTNTQCLCRRCNGKKSNKIIFNPTLEFIPNMGGVI